MKTTNRNQHHIILWPSKHYINKTFYKSNQLNSYLNINPLKTKLKLSYLKTQFVLRSKRFFISVTNRYMFCRAKATVCFEINTKHVHTEWAERTVFDC
jgi:hypothetical protein